MKFIFTKSQQRKIKNDLSLQEKKKNKKEKDRIYRRTRQKAKKTIKTLISRSKNDRLKAEKSAYQEIRKKKQPK